MSDPIRPGKEGGLCVTSSRSGGHRKLGHQLHPEAVTDPHTMAPGSVEKSAGSQGWARGAFRFMTDRNDFRRNLLLNLGLFVAGVWAARNMFDIDLMAPQAGM